MSKQIEAQATPAMPTNGSAQPEVPKQLQVTFADLQLIIGGKEIELSKLRQEAEEIIQRFKAENQALKAEVDRLTALGK